MKEKYLAAAELQVLVFCEKITYWITIVELNLEAEKYYYQAMQFVMLISRVQFEQNILSHSRVTSAK